jgi:hypothetical protein
MTDGGVAVDVSVDVGVRVEVGVAVEVRVYVDVEVAVGVVVDVAVAVGVGVGVGIEASTDAPMPATLMRAMRPISPIAAAKEWLLPVKGLNPRTVSVPSPATTAQVR